MNAERAVRVGAFTAYYRLAADRRGQRLERVNQQESDRLTQPLLAHPWPQRAQVAVKVGVFEADGRLFAGSVEVATVPEAIEVRELSVTLEPPAVDTLPVATELWRLVRLGELAREAVESMTSAGGYYEARDVLADRPEAFERLSRAAPDRVGRGGRPTMLTPEVLELVERAYRAAGPRGTRAAVQHALQAEGFPGSGADGQVTPDQAKKAIAKARAVGLLPPARSQ